MIRIGKIAAAHGLHGDLILVHVVGKSDWLQKDQTLFLELQKGSYIPFFTVQVRRNTDEEYFVRLDEVEKVEQARRLVGKAVYVKEDIISGHAAESPLLWIGFKLIDRNKGSLGQIEDVVQTGHQWLAKITWEGREVLVPLIEPMILDLNIKNRFIRMDLPEGLLDL